jgi:hypothetical protein
MKLSNMAIQAKVVLDVDELRVMADRCYLLAALRQMRSHRFSMAD